MEQPAIMDVDAISTHSLTRRLTGSGTNSVVGDGISTHSLTRRLTVPTTMTRNIVRHFNSQPHKEADAGYDTIKSLIAYFNSQPHKEADGSSIKGEIYEGNFNSQPHKEADKYYSDCSSSICNFNSQPHKEADKVGRKHNRTCRISTHSLTRRLTENKKENGK